MTVHGFGCVQLTTVSFVGVMATIGYVTGRSELVAPLWALLATGVTCLFCYGCHRPVPKDREITVIDVIAHADQLV